MKMDNASDSARNPDCTNQLDSRTWKRVTTNLAFRFGEFIFFRANFNALQCSEHFLKLHALNSPRPPVESIASNSISAAFIRSCPIETHLPRLSVHNGWIRYVTWQYNHQLVDCLGDFTEYEASFKRKTRDTLRRKIRKYRKLHGESDGLHICSTPEAMIQFHHEARKIAERTYQERMFGGGIPESMSYRKELQERAGRGEVIGYLLYLGDEAIAYTVGDYSAGGIIEYGYTGYDPSHGMISPGTVMQYLIIQSLIESDNVKYYDLCVGEAAHKKLFANKTVKCADIYFFRSSLKYWLLVLGHIFSEATNSFLARVFDLLRIKRFLKKFIRRTV